MRTIEMVARISDTSWNPSVGALPHRLRKLSMAMFVAGPGKLYAPREPNTASVRNIR